MSADGIEERALRELLAESGSGGSAECGDQPPAGALTGAKLIPVNCANILDAELQPPVFAMEPLMPRGHVTLLGGHGGAGKSVLALTIAATLLPGATGQASTSPEDPRCK